MHKKHSPTAVEPLASFQAPPSSWQPPLQDCWTFELQWWSTEYSVCTMISYYDSINLVKKLNGAVQNYTMMPTRSCITHHQSVPVLPWPKVHIPEGLFCFLSTELTYFSSSLRVDGLSVSKSISNSSGLLSFKAGSLIWMMCTTRPSFSPADRGEQPPDTWL